MINLIGSKVETPHYSFDDVHQKIFLMFQVFDFLVRANIIANMIEPEGGFDLINDRQLSLLTLLVVFPIGQMTSQLVKMFEKKFADELVRMNSNQK